MYSKIAANGWTDGRLGSQLAKFNRSQMLKIHHNMAKLTELHEKKLCSVGQCIFNRMFAEIVIKQNELRFAADSQHLFFLSVFL